MADKYTQADVDELGAKGHAFKDAAGNYDYPIADVDDLKDAIRAVGRGNADHDAIRKYIIARAKDLDQSDLIPDNWNADGSLDDADQKARVWTPEQRDTVMDVFSALDGAVGDALGGQFDWGPWVQDWYGDGSTDAPYTVIYTAGDDLWAAEFAFDDDSKVTVNTASARKVRPVSLYIDRNRNRRARAHAAAPGRQQVRDMRDEMRGVREERRVAISEFEIREVPNGAGGTNLKFAGYASVTCPDEESLDRAYDMEDWVGAYQEAVLRGAFTKTLSQNADVAFLVNHGGITMARTKAGTLRLAEDLTGLHTEATLNPSRGDVQILHAAVADGAVDEMSFAFRVIRQKWSYLEDNGISDRRFLQEVSLDKGDVSPVNYGANPHTGGLVSMRSAMGALLSGRGLTPDTWITAVREVRAGKTISQATYDALAPIHAHLLAGVDHALTLEQLLGMDADSELEDEDGGGQDLRLIALSDYTTAARAKLAAARGRQHV